MDQITHTVRNFNWKDIILECQNRPALEYDIFPVKDIILECQNRPAGMSAKQWMAENQISEKSYYYWQRKFRKEAFEQMNKSSVLPTVQESSNISFAEICIPGPKKTFSDIIPENIKPTAVIKTTTMTLALSNDISDNLLSRILQEVLHA